MIQTTPISPGDEARVQADPSRQAQPMPVADIPERRHAPLAAGPKR
jgi:hypothetical protein